MSKYKVQVDDYLSLDFRPEAIAHRLIKDTTTVRDTSVDIQPALTRLKYDIEEIDGKMKTISEANAESLLRYAEGTQKLSKEVGELRPAVENMTTTFAKLDHNFLRPYNRSDILTSTGEKLSHAAQLCRGLSWYLQLALQAQSQEYKRESVINGEGAGSSMFRVAHSLRTLQRLVLEFPDLKKIDSVARFETTIPDLRRSVVESANQFVRDATEINGPQVKKAAQTLIELGEDLSHTIKSHIRALVGTTVLQLSRYSGSSAEHEKTFADAQQRSRIVEVLVSIAEELLMAGTSSAEDYDFWKQVSMQLDQKLKTMSVANPAALKSMVASKTAILTRTQAVASVNQVFSKYLNK